MFSVLNKEIRCVFFKLKDSYEYKGLDIPTKYIRNNALTYVNNLKCSKDIESVKVLYEDGAIDVFSLNKNNK